MTDSLVCGSLAALLLCAAGSTSAQETVDLKYKFSPNEEVRWLVVQKADVSTTIQGHTQRSKMVSTSEKVCRFEASQKGGFKFVHSVDQVRMSREVSGQQKVTYDSHSDESPPPEYEHIADEVGVPIVTITMDSQGKILEREENRPGSSDPIGSRSIVVPLPDEPITVGHKWSSVAEVPVTTPKSGTKKIRTRQRYKLESINKGIATITSQAQVLTPTNDPAIDAQLIQELGTGTIRFDIEAGRVISHQIDLDEQVVAFQGPASNLRYVGRLTEKLIEPTPQTARRE